MSKSGGRGLTVETSSFSDKSSGSFGNRSQILFSVSGTQTSFFLNPYSNYYENKISK